MRRVLRRFALLTAAALPTYRLPVAQALSVAEDSPNALVRMFHYERERNFGFPMEGAP